MNISDMALRPCPFCGEAMVLHEDHHGQWWGHRDCMCKCPCSVNQIHDERDLKEWNMRAEDRE